MRTSQELDQLRKEAVALRRQGRSRRQIKEMLGFISNSTLNQILRGEPLPAERAGPGCLRVDVRRSGALYRQIEGWASAVTTTPVPNHATG
jgi:hypothetical protein